VHPGDTIWLRGGTYHGVFSSNLNGALGAGVNDPTTKIHVRQFPGEIAVIDGGATNIDYLLQIVGTYTWFWDITLTSSSTDRTSTVPDSYPTDLQRPYDAVQIYQSGNSGTGCIFINMIVKNCGQGFGLWVNAENAEVYGCLIYYNGWMAPDRDHGHSIYSQNQPPGTRWIRDNIMFGNYDYQMHGYTESSHVDNHIIDGNINYWAAAISTSGLHPGEWIVGGNAGTGNVITNNAIYAPGGNGGFSITYGLYAPVVQNNFSGGDGTLYGFPIYLDNTAGTPTITGNKFYADDLILPSSYATLYPNNNWYLRANRPKGTWLLVRPNLYSPGRGHVAIYNWDHLNSVSVDASTILNIGDNYEIRHAMNFRGGAVASGTYAGGTISFPMTGLAAETPAGASAPSVPSPAEFAAFVVVTVGAAGPTPTPTPTQTPGPPSPTPTPTRTPTPVPPTPTRTPTSSVTSTPTRTPTATPAPATATRTPTAPPPTPTPTPTSAASTPTGTPALPPPTATPSPTRTPPPPTSTPALTPTATATSFYSLTPCRLVDTRLAVGPLGGPALVAASERTFLLGNQCGIPIGATAIAFNVTVTQATTPGYLSLAPGGAAPPTSSTINYKARQTRAKNGIVGLGPAGDLAVYCVQNSGTVDFILDVTGYFR